MDALFFIIKNAIDNNLTLFIYIQVHFLLFARHFDAYCCSGEAGTGKTTFAQKLCAYVRSRGKIALGCAATALASQVSVSNI